MELPFDESEDERGLSDCGLAQQHQLELRHAARACAGTAPGAGSRRAGHGLCGDVKGRRVLEVGVAVSHTLHKFT